MFASPETPLSLRMASCNGMAASKEAKLKETAARRISIIQLDAPDPVNKQTKGDRRLVEKFELETSVMNQQWLQLIHIGQWVPRSPCTSMVVMTILRRGIRSSCPREDTGVTFNTANTSALKQNCIGNHLDNRELLEWIHHDRHLPSKPRSVNTKRDRQNLVRSART